MPFSIPSPIMQKVARLKALQHKDGKFLIWGNPAFIDPVYIQIYYHKLMENNTSFETANTMRYYTAKFQAMIGMDIINKRFGYAQTMLDKKRLLEFNMGQTEVLGLGKSTLFKSDFEKDAFIIRVMVSPFAEEYKRFFGTQKDPVDYWFMGAWAGTIESLIGKKTLCLENSCIAMGAKFCEFTIKPVEMWDEKDTIFKKNKFLLKEQPSLKDMGAEIPPYLQLK